MQSKLGDIYLKIETFIKENNKEDELKSKLKKLVREVYLKSLSDQDKGYCMKFTIPEKSVANLLDDIPVFTTDELKNAVLSDWGVPSNSPMYESAYYHNLLLMIVYALKTGDKKMAHNAHNLILFRMWNGRITDAFPRYCNPAIMNYVTSVMMNKKFYAHRYETPLKLIIEHFTPTIMEKYGNTVLKDIKDTKRLFTASFSRLRQIFRHDPVPDLKTGKSNYNSGLQPLYYRAAEKNLKVSSSGGSEALDDNFSSGNIESIVDEIKNYIVMETNIKYDRRFLDFLARDERIAIKKENIEKIYSQIHNIKYEDYIGEILSLIFSNMKTVNKSDICNDNFYVDIFKKRIISSKHSSEINDLKKITDKFISELFDDLNFKSDYKKTYMSQIKKVIMFFFAYNIKTYMCNYYEGQ